MSWCRCDDVWLAHVAVELLLKMRLKVLRLVARLGWSLLLRFLHKMLLVRLAVSCVSSVELNPYWRWSLELVLVLRKKCPKSSGRSERAQVLVETEASSVPLSSLLVPSWDYRKWCR